MWEEKKVLVNKLQEVKIILFGLFLLYLLKSLILGQGDV